MAFFVVILIFVAAVVYYLNQPVMDTDILSKEPRDPKIEIPVTYEIGWWSSQDSLIIDSFKVEIVESRLNLFNSKSLLKYTVKGKIFNSKLWEPFIEKIHISERFLRRYKGNRIPFALNDTSKIPEAVIEITPIVKEISNDDYKGEGISFEFENEIKLKSFHWGKNWVRFKCGDKWQDVFLQQSK